MGDHTTNGGKLEGMVAIVTGGASGIGRAICHEFAEQGATIVILDFDAEGGQEAATEIDATYGNAIAARADVTDFAQVREVAEKTARDYGTVDILVNCAGWHKFAKAQDYTIEDWQKIRSINLDGQWNCCQSVMPYMIKQNRGKIINIGSAAAILAIPKAAPYSIAKHAVVGLTRALAVDLASYNINVNCICPAAIDTPLLRKETKPAFIDGMVNSIPMGRIGKLSDISKAALFLASGDSDWITGVILPVDGGLTCCIRAHHYE